jgi:DNA helicase II / ATP-dependent DNA helicase PcrA
LSTNWNDGLNAEQVRAVSHNEGPMLILAGAGSGKTTVLVARAERLIREGRIFSHELCVLTFTNKAARELKHRVQAKLGKIAKGLWAGTFHSFGLMLLRRHHKEANLSAGFGILDPGDAAAIVKELLRDFNYGGKTAYDADRILSRISHWRERRQREATNEDEYEVAVEWLLPRYLKRLEHLGMVDFDGLLLRPLELMQENPDVAAAIQGLFRQLMVDEFQDTNQMQMALIQKLVEPHLNLSVVGDDDQSIYGWRGACISNILNFPKLYRQCEVVRLERNYRSTPAILKVANEIIAKNNQRHQKILRSAPDAAEGERPEVFVYENEHEEAENVATEIETLLHQGHHRKEIAVLYRSNSQGALLEAELRTRKIPYVMSGGTAFFDRKETRDILAYLRCAFKPNEVAFRRILNVPPRGIGEKTIDAITHLSKTQHLSFIESTRRWREAGVEEKTGGAIEEHLERLRTLIPFTVEDCAPSAGARLIQFFEEMGYRPYLEKYSGNAQVASKRWRLMELFGGILDRFVEQGGRKAETLHEFLDAMELRDVLNDKEDKEDRVQLLTLHACKGLEFPIVFLIGIEEDLLPHKVLGTDVSEERRLFYVGVTRAQKHLVLTRAKKRRKHGKWADSVPSRFLLEIPEALLFEHTGPRPAREEVRKSMIADLFKKLDSLSPVPTKP